MFELTAPVTGGGTKTLPPQGNHIGRCVQIIDMGTHWNENFGKWKRQVRLTFELPTELHVFDEDKGEEPFFVSVFCTLSMHENSTLRRHLESWRGKRFSDEEAGSFNIFTLADVPGMVNVTHSQDGKYADIASISPMPRGIECPAGVNPVVLFSPYMDKADMQQAWKALPDWMREKISESQEWQQAAQQKQQRTAPQVLDDAQRQARPEDPAPAPMNEPQDDDLPF